MSTVASVATWVLPHSSWDGFCRSWKWVKPLLVLHLQETLSTLGFLLRQFVGKVAHALQRHIVVKVEIEAQRELV